MKIIINYLLAPFLKKIEMLNNDVNESKSNIINLDKSIHKLQVELCDENKKNQELTAYLLEAMLDVNKKALAILDNTETKSDTPVKLQEEIEIIKLELNEKINKAEINIKNYITTTTRTLNIISKKQTYNKKTPTILFLIHNMNTWHSVANLYHELSADADLQVIIASIPRSFPGVDGYMGEDETSNSLARIGIHHMRITTSDDNQIATILTTLSPDIIFRQSPWDNDIPDGFSAEKINFAKICYVPYYAINIVESMSSGTDFDFQSNQSLHNNCWRIYCDTEYAYNEICRNSLLRGINARYFGHPKLDYIHTKMIESAGDVTIHEGVNILWAPHHSIDEGWLSFGTFDVNYLDFLKFAEENKKINIRLRPHPALFDFMKAKSDEMKNKVEDFVIRWGELENTSIDYDHDYIDSFKWSDILVTDGISFLVEYPLFHKPVIFIENDSHAKFNELGRIAVQCSHIAKNTSDVISMINKFEHGTLDNKQEAIDNLESILLPNKGRVHKIIASDIKTNL
ncbi:CDP-glycerol glycerophosphotransferase family protein [Serratia proteamaculans]|uniref:CDP-glycerol glycerophosphotransferase family protein n=1 Tax=Serratia proteamaculans TaxID=28151 RepID=UPI0024BBA0AC|nr:CDP-glycerol glycerophosphotransferase family protein [Serratia proteamaculans]